jgi:hypothetical protein
MLTHALKVTVLAVALAFAAVSSASATTYYAAPGLDGVETGTCSSQALGTACTLNYALGLAANPGDDVAVMAGTHSRTDVGTDLYVQPGVTIHGIPGQARPLIGSFGGMSCSCGVLRLKAGATARDIDVNYGWPYSAPYLPKAFILEGGSHLEGVKAFASREVVSVGFANGSGPVTISRSTLATRGANGTALRINDQPGQNTTVNVDQSTLRAADVSTGTGIAASSYGTPTNVSITVNVHNSIVRGGFSDASIYGSTAHNVITTANFNSSSIDFANIYSADNGTAVNLGGNVAPEPAFYDNGLLDYVRPVSGSNTIDAGSAPFPATDITGAAFFSGCAPDIGAYETVTGTCPPPTAALAAAKILAGIKLSVNAKRKQGKVVAKVTCPKAAIGSCAGILYVKKGKAKAKTTKVKAIRPGKAATIKAKAKKGKTAITVTLADTTGTAGSKTISKKLK